MSDLAFDMSGGIDPVTGIVRQGKENQAFVHFYRGSKRDNFSSQEAGVPIEKQVDYVRVHLAGERDSAIYEVTEHHKRRWPQAWANYERGAEQAQNGTPLDVLFPRNPEIVATLKANHVWTVQALAAVPDSVTSIPFISDHKKRAQGFLDGLAGGQKFHQLERDLENERLKGIELEDRIKALEKALSDSTKPKTKE